MNFIQDYIVDFIRRAMVQDDRAFISITQNNLLNSYPHLQTIRPSVLQAYANYTRHNGNALQINPVGISRLHKNYLTDHYNHPPQALDHIPQLREETDHLCCPMCGSADNRGTLDHIFPQSQFPEFIVFSWNLVPACKCNRKRGNTLLGARPNERILHPYFDQCLQDRLITADFQNLDSAPTASIKLLVTPHQPYFDAIKFHVESVVKKTTIEKYLRRKWIKFCRKPKSVIRDFKNPIHNTNDLQAIFQDVLDDLDDYHESKNNWESVFVSGLLEQHVMQWIMDKLNAPNYIPGRSSFI